MCRLTLFSRQVRYPIDTIDIREALSAGDVSKNSDAHQAFPKLPTPSGSPQRHRGGCSHRPYAAKFPPTEGFKYNSYPLTA